MKTLPAVEGAQIGDGFVELEASRLRLPPQIVVRSAHRVLPARMREPLSRVA
jgi:hypothetical protein